MDEFQNLNSDAGQASEPLPLHLALRLAEGVHLNLPPGAEPAIHRFAADFVLTRREKEVVSLICCGHKNETIARALKLSLPTVRFHMHNIHKKTGTSDKLDIVIRIWADSYKQQES